MSEELQLHEQGEKIFVSIRLRPLQDKARNRICDWECVNNDTIVFKNSLPERSMFPAAYTFDRVFDSESNTIQVYEEGAKHIALSVLEGINSSIFAYGQTSSGKTYTMRGITEYAVSDIYDCIERQEERDFVVKFCAMEIYNEAVRDLLSPDSYPLRVLDDPERGTVVEKLTEVALRDRDHLHELLTICEAQRQIGETALNETSSRSHQILRLTIESSAREYGGAGNSSILAASVNFVDLAGSERASQTSAAGTRLKEGCHINRSLLTLGTVIRKLSKGRTGHVPYRDSKLTRILQNALGGNARTAIICTMSPERIHVEQSRNTLLFAKCAREVRTNAQVNLIMSDKALVKQLQRELARLEKEMRSLGSASVKGDTAGVLREKEKLIGQMAKEIEDLTWQRDIAQSRVENLLLSVREVQMLKQSTNSSKVAKVPCKVGSNKREDTVALSANNQYLGLAENPEEDFLLDGMTPKFVGPDPCKDWEIFEKMDQEFEDREVPCVEIGDSRNTMNKEAGVHFLSLHNNEGKLGMEEAIVKKTGADDFMTDPKNIEGKLTVNESSIEKQEGDGFSPDPENKQGKLGMIITTNENVVTSPRQEDLQSIPVYNDQTYKGLNQRIHELQRTVNFLVNVQHVDQSPSFSDISSSSSRRSLSRSKSCKAVVSTVPSSPYFEKEALNESTPLFTGVERDFVERPRDLYQKFSELKFDNISENMSRRNSRTSVSSSSVDTLNLKDLDAEDTFGATNFPPRPWKSISEDPLGRISTSTVLAAGGSPTKQPSKKQIDNNSDDKQLQSNWPSEFEEKQRQIIELWDACNVSLSHRSYFIQLFKGDPSDCLYMEIELRRLKFQKDSISDDNGSQRESPICTTASGSEKELIRERVMLSKQIRSKLSRKQREELYKKWEIDLNTKQRSLQVARLVWTDTKDMEHVRESAAVVAKVLGFVEPSQAPKEVVGLSILPRFLSRRSHSWSLRLPSLF
ncbi:hypothetical protein E1A91_A05G201300v1 [Gossypium mustelinum]|uniref:Kinesin-like protein n=1 Tax=Gossypium mustelinum TaxID=34275 RepID=A0A5D2Z9L8_GOSMU|nr:hypothetical protein E1A91_A05G201300v1 [Gossypium mustelinum]